ncbi:HlyC/CorC family transporter [Halovulum dunhuangense]|uniref:HlyC/CorC family transporter n=1 Tax=Halovulum dunhuangense TaxID=1505036 RepID=A0A849L2P2_9RHOB|nr:HlyC/CorC family transporter [Halovulum dunhuangense]NNU80555.1 HlyC/CorC family transporter [Halovulum dunhuangense]
METETATLAAGLDAALLGTVLAVVALLVMSAFFSGSETALTASSRGKLHSLADKGSKGAETALRLTEDNERLIGAVLLGNNMVNILATSLATSALTVLFGDSGVAVATLVMTALVLVFAEVMPKTYAITNAETAASRVAPVIAVVVRFLSPIVNTVRWLVRLILAALGVQTDPKASIMAAQEEIAGAIALHHSEGAVQREARDRLLGALDLGQREVEEIMLHRQNIEMIDADLPPQEILSTCLKSPHTRIPVYRGEPENVVGVIHAKDLLRAVDALLRRTGGLKALEKFDVMDVAMEPYFVPETTTLEDQMREFLRRKTHFALVVDEYGALRGLITLEDILEEIVGEIADEHDREEQTLTPEPDGSVTIEGGMTIRDLNRACEWNLPDDEANTVAGLVIHEAQTIPTEGQIFNFHGFRFQVLERERNRLTKLRVRKLE